MLYNLAVAGEMTMMSILRRLKERLFGSDKERSKSRAIRREQETLRRWSERGQNDRFNI